jgi:hypothetical protein
MATPEQPQSDSTIPAAEQHLLDGVEPRIARIMLVLGILGTVSFLLWQGAGWAAGFAIGAALSGLSFHWMKFAVKTLSESATAGAAGTGTPEAARAARGTSGAVLRFVLRYALIGIAGYVIFRSSVLSLAAFFAGLFVAVAAVVAEIVYEIVLSFRRT